MPARHSPPLATARPTSSISRVGARAGGAYGRIAVAHRDFPRIDVQDLCGNLRERRLMTLPVRMHTHVDDELAVTSQACGCGLQSGDKFDTPTGVSEGAGAIGGLLVE